MEAYDLARRKNKGNMINRKKKIIIYYMPWYHIPKDRSLNIHSLENPRFKIPFG
jgi:hypothetical protein